MLKEYIHRSSMYSWPSPCTATTDGCVILSGPKGRFKIKTVDLIKAAAKSKGIANLVADRHSSFHIHKVGNDDDNAAGSSKQQQGSANRSGASQQPTDNSSEQRSGKRSGRRSGSGQPPKRQRCVDEKDDAARSSKQQPVSAKRSASKQPTDSSKKPRSEPRSGSGQPPTNEDDQFLPEQQDLIDSMRRDECCSLGIYEWIARNFPQARDGNHAQQLLKEERAAAEQTAAELAELRTHVASLNRRLNQAMSDVRFWISTPQNRGRIQMPCECIPPRPPSRPNPNYALTFS